MNSGDILEGLNPQQKQAVEHIGTPLLIIAGAGSGKTAVLTRRIAYLLRHRGVHHGEILAITFTNKAAREMRERVIDLVGPRAERMWVSTFHSTCVRFLREQAHLVPGLNTNFSIYDSDDSRRLLAMIIKDMNLDAKRFSARSVANAISNWKNELVGPEEALADSGFNPESKIHADIYARYQSQLRSANAVDFDDLIGEVVTIFRNHPQVTEAYRRRFRHVLIDEYQDTNHAQYALVSELVGLPGGAVPPSELCVVGDADQSIYAFRGASIRNIEEFERDYPNATTILLEQNYRSTQTILSAANAVIAQNSGRREKKLWTAHGDGEPIVGYVADNEHDEATFVARKIDELTEEHGASYSDIAVMYRTNNSSRPIEDAFMRAGLPYRVVGGTRFYERKEVRDIIAYLKVMENPQDEVSLRRIINTPRRGIGDRAIAMINAHMDAHRQGFMEALAEAAESKVDALGARAKNSIKGFLDLIHGLQESAEIDENTGLPNLAKLVASVLDMTGYRAELEKSNDPQDGTRLDNLNEFVSLAREFTIDAANARAYDMMDGGEDPLDATLGDGLAAPGSLAAFLEKIALVADADQIPDDGQGLITMMTLHTAKGLEFPYVFIVGWEDGQFPHMRSLGNPAELAEERRLAYVGITRARTQLFVSRALVRSSWGALQTNPASRFLEEIPKGLLNWEREDPGRNAWMGGGYFGGNFGGGGYGGGRNFGGSSGNNYRTFNPEPLVGSGGGPQRTTNPNNGVPASSLKLAAGDRVNHEKYGLGMVEAVSMIGSRETVLIDFGSKGRVRIMLLGNVPMEKL